MWKLLFEELFEIESSFNYLIKWFFNYFSLIDF